ncbi:hypothetical protein ACUN3E_37305 [Streptomyces sp. Ju416(a)]|uniref:hypothetical protein n=1 Tax=Streptomyces sp. Ju416(a) TaxID=3446591 RepID=UPI00403DE210
MANKQIDITLQGGPADGRTASFTDHPPKILRIQAPDRKVELDPATGAVIGPNGESPLDWEPPNIVDHDYELIEGNPGVPHFIYRGASDRRRAGLRVEDVPNVLTRDAACLEDPDPRIQRLASARWRLGTGRTHEDWLHLWEVDREAIFRDVKESLHRSHLAGTDWALDREEGQR